MSDIIWWVLIDYNTYLGLKNSEKSLEILIMFHKFNLITRLNGHSHSVRFDWFNRTKVYFLPENSVKMGIESFKNKYVEYNVRTL